MSTRFSGVTYDWYDDQGETLKQKFPTRDSLPDVIKSASVQPKEKLANEQFALVMQDGGHIFRKYACHDAGTTAMSAIYFMEHGDKLPLEAQKVAAANLTRELLHHGVTPPAAMLKLANGDEEEEEGGAPTAGDKDRIRSFIRSHDNLSDDAFHEFVESNGINPHLAESVVYDMAHDLSKKAADMIPGGKADKMTDADFPKDQMAMGKKVEMEHTNDPKKAREIARDHLEEFGDYYTRLDKMEAEAEKAKEKKGHVLDITGLKPPTQIKLAQPESDNDYAVVLPGGKRLYPIHTWDLMKTAEQYWTDNRRLMEPEVRHQFATKLAAKSNEIGYPLDADILEAGSPTYADPDHMQTSIDMRKIACEPGEDRDFLDGLLEKRAEIQPTVFAEVLRRFDVQHGLDKGWDHVVPDPWMSTFGIDKTANVVWESGVDRVTERALQNLAENNIDIVSKQFTDDMANEFRKDPVGIFNSMPEPMKKLLARLASDSESVGETEAGFTR